MASDRIDKFQAASRNLQLQPLLGLVCDENTNQFVFAGHRGCEKSTLLFEFSQISPSKRSR